MKKSVRKICQSVLFAGLTVAVTLPGFAQSLVAEATASQINDVKNQIQNTQNKMDTIQDKIETLTDEQAVVEERIDDLNAEIINTMASIQLKTEELDAKEQEIADKTICIQEMQVQIEQAQKEYEEAKKRQEKQYEDMLVRVRSMYENGNATLLGMVIQGDGLSNMLNRMDYVEKVYAYDRTKLQEYEETKVQVETLRDTLIVEQEQLETQKKTLETDKQAIADAKTQLESQRSSLNQMLTQKKKESANFDAEIKKAKEDAAAAAKLLKQETQQLDTLQKEQKKQQEQKARQEETAKKQATMSTQEVTKQLAKTDAVLTEQSAKTSQEFQQETATTQVKEESQKQQPVAAASTGSNLGQQIADYACQFVGNPYVLGGTSLTNGADCSGFTYRVYSDFGYRIPRTSYEQRSAGRGVDYSEAQPGDLICYDGHVAMYIGGGKIVHASTQKTGIKYGTATYRNILAVRRIL